MSKKAKIILIIGIVLIVLIGSYFGYRAWKKSKDEREANKNKTGDVAPPSTTPSTTKEDAIVTIVYAKAGRKSADFATGYSDGYLIAWANALKTPNTSVFKFDNKWYTTSDGKWTPLK